MPYKDPVKRRAVRDNWRRGTGRAQTNTSISSYRLQRRQALDEIKLAAGCIDCGYRGHPAALDFDHREGETKMFTISHSGVSSTRLMAEVAKCDVRCANCHRIKTEERRGFPGAG